MPDAPAVLTPPAEDHEVQMVRIAAASNPTLIPTQFAGDVEKYVTSWKDTRAALTKAQQELAVLKAGGTAPVKAVEAPKEGDVESLVIPDAPVAPKRVPLDRVKADLAAGGKVTPETRTILLNEHGIGDEEVDALEQGIRAQQILNAQQAAALIGGMDVLKQVTDWAARNLKAEEKAAVNAALANPGTRGTTLLGLKARMDAAPGSKEPAATPGVVSMGQSTDTSGFASRQEMVNAMRDPRYGKDEAYTQSVYAKVNNSNFPKV